MSSFSRRIIAFFLAFSVLSQHLIGVPQVFASAADSDILTAFVGKSGAGNTGSRQIDLGLEDTVSFQPDLFSGAAQISLPFSFPVGINGLTPQQALSYQSYQVRKNSDVGYGWSMEFPKITRMNKNGIDAMYSSPVYQLVDFGIQGELVEVASSAGQKEFRMKKEQGYVRCYYYESENRWEIVLSDGTLLSFGATAASRLQNSDGSLVFGWSIDKMRSVHGTEILYEYAQFDSYLYPKSVRYGATSGSNNHPFEIRYEPFYSNASPTSNRFDQQMSYDQGFQVKYRHVVDQVQIFVDGQKRMAYELSYLKNPDESRTDLKQLKISSFGSLRNVSQEVTFSYYDAFDGYQDKLFQNRNLLKMVHFFHGGEVEFNYLPSHQFVTGGFNNRPHYPVFVLSSLVKKDAMGASYTTTYEYHEGSYYADSIDLRTPAGFGRVTTTDPAGQKMVNSFHQGGGFDGSALGESTDDSWYLIGKPYRTEIYDAQGRLMDRNITRWDQHDLGNNRRFVFASDQVSTRFNVSGQEKSSASHMVYDDATGNMLEQEMLGEVQANNDGTYTDIGNDKRKMVMSYAQNSALNLLSFPSRQQLFDDQGALISQVETNYDQLPFGQVQKGDITLSKASFFEENREISTSSTYNSSGLITSTTDALGRTSTVVYDASGIYPASVSNALGHTVLTEYDLMFGKAIRSTDPNGMVSEVDLDGLGRPIETRVTDPAAGSPVIMTQMEYLESSFPHALKTLVFLDDSTTTETVGYMDGFGRAVQSRAQHSESGKFVVSNTHYDSLGRADRTTLPVLYDGDAYNAAETSAIDTRTTYDVFNRPVSVTDANGTTTSSYDRWSSTITDANGNTKTSETDAFGRLVKVIEREGGQDFITRYQYESRDLLTQLSDSQGNIRNFSYDSLARMMSQEDLHAPADTVFGIWSYTYDDNGNTLTTRNPRGQIIENSYDQLNRLVGQQLQGDPTTAYILRYDQASAGAGVGRLTSLQTPTQQWQGTYDVRGRMLSETNTIAGANYSKTYSYTRFDQPSTVNYPDGTSIDRSYDEVGQLEALSTGSKTIANGLAYSPINQITQINYGNGVQSTMSYDPAQMYRMTNKFTKKITTTSWWQPYTQGMSAFFVPSTYAKTAAQVRRERTLRQRNGNVPSLSNPTPVVPDAQLEALFNDRSQDATAAPVQQNSLLQQLMGDFGFGFNDPILDPVTGQLTMPQQTPVTPLVIPTGTNGKSELTMMGDAQGNISSNIQGVISVMTTYSNSDANPETATGFQLIINKDGRFFWQDSGYQAFSTPLSVGQNSPALYYDLNALSDTSAQYSLQIRLQLASGVVTPASDPVSFTLNPNHIPGAPLANVSPTQTSPLDPTPTVENLNPPVPPTGDIKQQLSYVYDAVGNITQVTESADTPSKGVKSYAYDDLYRLTHTTVVSTDPDYGDYTQSYSYDSVGNLLTKSDQGNYSYGQPGKTNPQAVTSITDPTTGSNKTFEYDASGNLIREQITTQPANTIVTKTFVWDHYDRMKTSTVENPDGSSVTTSYDYDSGGRRLRKQVESIPAGMTTGSVSTTVYPFPDFELTDLGHTKVSVMAGSMHVGTIEYDGGQQKIYYSHTDHLGGGNIMTTEYGNVAQSIDYFPFGSLRVDEQYGQFDERLKFTGHELDDETGLYYAQARYYDAEIGRFVSQDPAAKTVPEMFLRDPLQLNYYSYVRNHPVNAIDPDGLLTVFVHGTDSGPSKYKENYIRTVTSEFGDSSAIVFDWSVQKFWDSNSHETRIEASGKLNKLINEYQFSEGETLNIVAHSHGGNVAIGAINMGLPKQVDNLVLMGTPNRQQYQLQDKEDVKNGFNIYSSSDLIQAGGGVGDGKILGRKRGDNFWNLDVGTAGEWTNGYNIHLRFGEQDIWDNDISPNFKHIFTQGNNPSKDRAKINIKRESGGLRSPSSGGGAGGGGGGGAW